MFLVIGTVTADLLVRSDAPLAQAGDDGFRSSNLVFTDAPVAVSLGGNGGNSAYVLAGLGAPTALCGAVGQDLLGDVLVNWLAERKVNLDGLLRSATQATSTSTILMANGASQVVLHHLGSTREISLAGIPPRAFRRADALLVSGYSIMAKLRAGGLAQALARVREAGGLTALDVGPAIGEPVTLAELGPLLPGVDYLIANTHELVSLTGAAAWPQAGEQVLAAGARRLVIKQGGDGSAVWSAAERVSVPAFPVEVHSSVGAGDAFNGGFLYALQQGWPLDEALRWGNGVAALVVSSPWGILGAPSLAQVEAFLGAVNAR